MVAFQGFCSDCSLPSQMGAGFAFGMILAFIAFLPCYLLLRAVIRCTTWAWITYPTGHPLGAEAEARRILRHEREVRERRERFTMGAMGWARVESDRGGESDAETEMGDEDIEMEDSRGGAREQDGENENENEDERLPRGVRWRVPEVVRTM
jgi:hypothetical protein